jgi:excisionase family DNA binding protein
MALPMTTRDVARLLNVSAERVRQLSNAGVLEATRTESGIRLFDRAQVTRVAETRQGQRAAQ